MSENYLASGRDFESALAAYHEPLLRDNLGIIPGATISNKSGTGGNILVTAIGIIVGAFTGFGFYRLSEAVKGTAILTHDGVHFLSTTTKRERIDGVRVKNQVITGHSYVGYNQVNKAIRGRIPRQISLIGRVEDANERSIRYRINLPISGNDESIDNLKDKLDEQGIRPRRSRAGRFVALLMLAFIAFLAFAIFLPRLTNSYREMDYTAFRREINAPTSTSSGRYQDRTTSFVARFSTDVFTIDTGEGHTSFIGATIAGNDRIFLLELNEDVPTPEIGDVANITAIGMGAIATRPRPEQTTADRFFENMGVAFGDPRVSGVVEEISETGILSGTYYLHMRATEIEIATPIVLGESDTYVSASGNFTITFVDAFFSTRGAGQHQRDIIAIFFDYEALEAHGAGRPFNRFVVYQGDVELETSDGGIRANDADGRGFLTTQRLEPGEIFRGMSSVFADNLTDPITLVVYGTTFDILFMYELTVR